MKTDYLFSIIIPTWNNLPLLKLCIESILKNSYHHHQIVVHVNEGKDGTVNWLKEQKIDYTYSTDNVGICHAVNQAFSKTKASYIVYMNDDMYACPKWDFYLKEAIDKQTNNLFFLSGTMIEPTKSGNRCALAPYDFGNTPESFQENKLLKEFDKIPFKDWNGATWPPNLIHREMWEKIGGFSPEFSPGMYSDPDFSMKLWQEGVRYFKGVSKRRVYHFQSRSTGKVVKNDGRKQFFEKWDISASTFYKNILQMGTEFKGNLSNKPLKPSFTDKLKKLL